MNIFNVNNKIKTTIMDIKFFTILISLTQFLFSCKGLITVDSPNNRISDKNVFSLDETAIAMVTNLYSQLDQDDHSFSSDGRLMNISLYAALSSDEISIYGANNVTFYQLYTNSLTANNGPYTWSDIYTKIFVINSAIIGITNSKSLSSNIQRQLLGEMKFMRAFCYFYLVNLYGDVPLVLSIDPLVNASLARETKDKVYDQILDDLKSAQTLLSESYLSGNLTGSTNERVRPTKWAATALLARVYLYLSNYVDAEEQSNILINHSDLYSLDSLNGVFIKNSKECIWQIQNVYNTGANTGEGQTFILPSTGPDGNTYPVYLSDYIVNDFENGDLRKNSWVSSIVTATGSKYYFPYKYKSGALTASGASTEYLMVFRLGEQYLIRAEARLQQGKTDQGLTDINKIRERAGLIDITTTSKDSLLNILLHERKMELFTEWGHRWFDLKRTNTVNSIMDTITAAKGGVWQTFKQLYPISTTELLADPNLVQNIGY